MGKTVGFGLLSGGLDSTLAFKILQQQGIDLVAVSFVSPFFSSRNAESAAQKLGVPILIEDITDELMEIVKNPPHGYGGAMNPCIDCHGLMFRVAGRLMDEHGGDFLFSGEVLGQRPMSQNRRSLQIVEQLSGRPGYVLRPLSAKLLPETIPEIEGKVDREMLLDIKGRSRKRQMAMAAEYGITDFPSPAGGCRLTESGYAEKLKDLLQNNVNPERRDLEFLTLGRNFRLSPELKLIVGRNKEENEILIGMFDRSRDIMLTASEHKGPVTLIVGDGGVTDEHLEIAARVCVRYSSAPSDDRVNVTVDHMGETREISVCAADQKLLNSLRIGQN